MYRSLLRQWPIVGLLALFGILYSLTLNSYGMFLWDEAEYASIARSLLHGEGFAISGKPNALRPPVLPLAGAASMALFGEQFDDSVLRMVTWAFALLALLLVYGFAAAVYGRGTGLAAATLLGISPLFWIFVPYFLSEIPFLAFFAAAVWLFYLGAYKDRRCFAWSWVCWALAFLTRYTASLFLPVIVLMVALAWWLGGEDTRRRLWSRAFFLSPLSAAPLLLPWFLREYSTFGDPLAGLRKASTQLQVYLPGISMPWHYYLKRMPALLSPEIAILFAAGAAVGCMAARPLCTAQRPGSGADPRVVQLLPLQGRPDRELGASLHRGGGRARTHRGAARLRPRARYVVVGTLLAGFAAVNYRAVRPVFQHTVTLGYPSFLDAMNFLRTHARPGATVVGANFPQIFWYSGLNAVRIPDEAQLPEALRHSEWMVITNFEPEQQPYVWGLIDLEALTEGPDGSAESFRDDRVFTAVIRSDRMLRALGKR